MVLLLVCGVATVPGPAQKAAAAVRLEAYSGQPFGIGRITIDLPQGASATPWSDDRFGIAEANGRVLYPVTENSSVRRVLRNFLGIETPWRATLYFMFRGDEPLDVTLYAPEAQQLTIRPERDRREFEKLVDDWWEATCDRYQHVYRQTAYPVVAENYLTATWARRLGREMPEPRLYLLRIIEWGDSWFSQLMANEAYQNSVERDLLLGRFDDREQATVRLPGSVNNRAHNQVQEELPRPDSAPTSQGDSARLAPGTVFPETVEPIAGRVPRECFYLRFGNFPNYLWFRDFMHHWQGDLANMFVLQSVNHGGSARFQQQIAVGETELARVMGPRVVRDVAIIGFDPYLRDGAAMGILFQANISALLAKNLNDQRHAAMAAHQGATEDTVAIAGHDVSYISSPDGRLRSYLAIDGDYLLVTTSRRLVERFFAAGAGDGSLAMDNDFVAARAAMPQDRDDTMFLFASPAFFENLTGAHYRVELDRRLRSIGEMRSLQLARLAARAEGREAQSIDELINADLLPARFGQRADGSRLVDQDGELHDSLRGVRGSTLPIADTPIDTITSAEAARYAEFQRGMENRVGRFVPITVAMKRTPSPVNNEWDRIAVDIHLSNYSQSRLAPFIRMLGPAAPVRVAPIGGDVVAGEIIVDALGQPVHLFGGLRDFRAPLVVRQGEVQASGNLADFLRAYVGGFPRPHLLDRIFGSPTGPFDEHGIARNDRLFDLWLRRADDFFLFSLRRDVLLEVGPQLAMVEAERSAQIRLRVDDLSDKQLATAVSGLGYMRARATSASGPRFMNSLIAQLHVPPAEARVAAEQLVEGSFTCPLGGDYVLAAPNAPPLDLDTHTPSNGDSRRPLLSRDAQRSEPNTEELPPLEPPTGRLPPSAADDVSGAESTRVRQLWTSTAVTPANRFLLTEIPADYEMPLMQWFRGITAEVSRGPDELSTHVDLDMVRLDVAPEPTESGEGFKLPSLGGLFGDWGKSKDEQVRPAGASESLPPPAEK